MKHKKLPRGKWVEKTLCNSYIYNSPAGYRGIVVKYDKYTFGISVLQQLHNENTIIHRAASISLFSAKHVVVDAIRRHWRER